MTIILSPRNSLAHALFVRQSSLPSVDLCSLRGVLLVYRCRHAILMFLSPSWGNYYFKAVFSPVLQTLMHLIGSQPTATSQFGVFVLYLILSEKSDLMWCFRSWKDKETSQSRASLYRHSLKHFICVICCGKREEMQKFEYGHFACAWLFKMNVICCNLCRNLQSVKCVKYVRF